MSILLLEDAKTGRSTCRATGEHIPKGAARVGLEAYVGGRVVMTWQSPTPFLENCYVELCKSSTGVCKATGHKFAKGEARFVATSKDKKVFLTVDAAAKEVAPILNAAPAFQPADFKGLDDLSADQRRVFERAFGAPSGKQKPNSSRSDRVAARQIRREEDAVARGSPAPQPGGDGLDQPVVGDKEGTPAEAADGTAKAPGPKGTKTATENVNPNRANPAKEAPPSSPSSPTAHLTEYEKARAAQIARNRAMLMSLNIPSLTAQMQPQAPPARPVQPRGLATKRKKPEEDAPRRMSQRVRGIASDGIAVDEELRGGKVIVVKGERIRLGPGALRAPSPPKERHPQGTLPFKSENGEEGSDAAFLSLLQGGEVSSSQMPQWESPSSTKLPALKLEAADVAKVTRDGVTHLAFHPSTNWLVLAAGDKAGHIGLWDVDHARSAGAAQGDAPSTKDVLEFKNHYSYISGLRWAGGSGAAARLFTCAYDGSVRVLDPAAAASNLVWSDEDAEYSAFDASADGNTVYIADKDGNLEVVDVRSGSPVQPAMSLHDKKINTLHVEPGEERQLASACADNSLAIWDVRKLGRGAKVVARAGHTRTCQSAFWAPDGSMKVLTTSRDNTVKIWDGKKGLAALHSIRHDNDTGRWISPFRATWGYNAEAVIIGNMKRTVDIFDSDGSMIAALRSDNMTATSARNVVHPQLSILASSSGSGRMYVWR